jgi:uncharacterized protein
MHLPAKPATFPQPSVLSRADSLSLRFSPGLRWVVSLVLLTIVWLTPVRAAEPSPALREAVRVYETGRVDAARAAFEALLARGEPAAAYNLAVMHLRGELAAPDAQQAQRLMLRAAQGGFVTAQIGLAQLLETGVGSAVDLAGSQQWYLRAADAGSVEAQVAAGTNLYLGRGTARDRTRAAHWYERAALGGDVGAQYLIASMHEQGDGVAADLQRAQYWYAQAARNGDVAAAAKLRHWGQGPSPKARP